MRYPDGDNRYAQQGARASTTVYVLELAGTHDAFAAYEAQTGGTDVSVRAPGLAVARGLKSLETLAFTHRASELLGWADPTVADARTLLQATGLDRSGTVAVRAVDVRGSADIDTQAVERGLGDVLVDRGFEIDLESPDHELRALFSAGDETSVCALGWLTAESTRGYGQRKPSDRPFFQPGSMDPMLARALANIAGAGPGQTILDPMCGTGGILIEAGLVGATVVGLDAQTKMLQGSAENFEALIDQEWCLMRGDAARLPLANSCVDGIVFDTPYGRQSKIAGELDELVDSALREARRVAPQCVVVGDRSWRDHATRAGWSVDATFERRVHKSLTRYIVVLKDR